jgi:hypothetical protein
MTNFVFVAATTALIFTSPYTMNIYVKRKKCTFILVKKNLVHTYFFFTILGTENNEELGGGGGLQRFKAHNSVEFR